MSLLGPYVGLVLVALAAASGLALARGSRRRAVDHSGDPAAAPGLARLRAAALWTRSAALAIGVVLVALVSHLGGLGRGLMLAPAAFGGAQVLGVLVADLVARGAARMPGVAALEVRRVRDFVPRRLLTLVAVTAVSLGALLAWTVALGVPDDLGRAGRALGYSCGAGCTGRRGPWPGSYYAVPLIAALSVVVLLAVLALATTVHRPRNGADAQIRRVDGTVRRRAAESVLAGVGVAVAGSLCGVALVAAETARHPDLPTSVAVGGWFAAGAGVLGLATLVWSAALLLAPGSAGSTSTGPATPARPGRVEA
jgi:hypothetical protein